MAFRLFGCPAEGRHDAIDAPASVAEFNALGQAALTRCAGAWGGEFLVDAHGSLLAQAAPDMASRLIGGRRAIAHHKLEACYARFLGKCMLSPAAGLAKRRSISSNFY